MFNRIKNGLLLLSGLIILSGCQYHHEDLEQWVKEVENKPKLPARKLPEVKPYLAFDYAAGNLNSPFMKVVPEADSTLINLSACDPNGPKPDIDRRKEPLERVPIQNLAMVGSMLYEGENVAIVLDANTGIHHRVKTGQYLGLNYGKVVDLTETEIKLTEIIPNGQGCWETHDIKLQLGLTKN
ncbi:MAG: pilus assembly protein PilP [Gammaproteobacteria bacterium CG22_combo_CG10-13_8_21_14_all_40_8]|nr:MAG: pilus assembly protein PilP [Gammaproteobacteria bacterium CG22_combo_CG10-13_8_21_14_all_40_8]